MNAPKTLTAEAGWTHQDLAITFPSFRDAARVQIFLEGAPVEVEMLYCTALYCIVLYCAVLYYCTVLYLERCSTTAAP